THPSFTILYLLKKKICRVMLMATLFPLIKTKTMLPMPNGKSKMHKESIVRITQLNGFNLSTTLLPLTRIVSPSLIFTL
ncbi:hypothetical protein CR513_33056, partial [Mucuna pruriens]